MERDNPNYIHLAKVLTMLSGTRNLPARRDSSCFGVAVVLGIVAVFLPRNQDIQNLEVAFTTAIRPTMSNVPQKRISITAYLRRGLKTELILFIVWTFAAFDLITLTEAQHLYE